MIVKPTSVHCLRLGFVGVMYFYVWLHIFVNHNIQIWKENKISSRQDDESVNKIKCLTRMSNDSCHTCLNGWYGSDCGIPPHPRHVNVTARESLAYIVQVTIVNHEIDMLKLKIENSLPYTDEFIVVEGDKTFALQPKIFYVQKHEKELQSLIKLRQHHVRILAKNKYSWDVQNEMRLRKTTLHELYPDIPVDAIVIFTDMDECIRPEILYFLKYYNSSPFPTGVNWDTFLFGFFFHDPMVISPSSFGTVNQSPHFIRSQPTTWTISKGGWHCSWCFTIPDLQLKLKSSPFVDLPRIADNPKFMRRSIIYDHIINGKWFLGRKTISRSEPKDIPINTPVYMRSYDWWLQHPPNTLNK